MKPKPNAVSAKLAQSGQCLLQACQSGDCYRDLVAVRRDSTQLLAETVKTLCVQQEQPSRETIVGSSQGCITHRACGASRGDAGSSAQGLHSSAEQC